MRLLRLAGACALAVVPAVGVLAGTGPASAGVVIQPPHPGSIRPQPPEPAEPTPPHPGYAPKKVRGYELTVASVSPQTATYGTGIVVTVRLTRPVPAAMRDEIASKLKVKSTKKLGTAGWAWRDSQTVLFRPREFWPAHSKITVVSTPDYSVLGYVPKDTGTGQTPLRWAARVDHSFRIGRSQVITVNSGSHTAKVVRDGKRIRTMGVSLGMPGWETRSGIKVLMDKYYVKRMTSQSIGAPEEYALNVPYAIRLTDSGEFIHAAPWAVGRIGRWNGSHGCTNLFMSDAAWLYNNRLYGDPVITMGTPRHMDYTNGMGGPWNVPWALWRSGRAG